MNCRQPPQEKEEGLRVVWMERVFPIDRLASLKHSWGGLGNSPF